MPEIDQMRKSSSSLSTDALAVQCIGDHNRWMFSHHLYSVIRTCRGIIVQTDKKENERMFISSRSRSFSLSLSPSLASLSPSDIVGHYVCQYKRAEVQIRSTHSICRRRVSCVFTKPARTNKHASRTMSFLMFVFA